MSCIRRYILRVLIQLDQAEELEHVTDWSGIWHNFDVIETSIRRPKRVERKKDNRIVAAKESSKGKLEKETNACPTHLVLRQEDGAVRPEKKIALETKSRAVTKRNAKDTRNKRIAR